jgi:hypothetical protein
MPIFLIYSTISNKHIDIAENENINISKKANFIIRIFYPSGEPISLHQLRCSPFAVYKYSIMGHCLAAAAILSRE